jgi:hypothetical protein
MIHLQAPPDKRSIDKLVDELIAQGFGRGEIAAHMRRVAHRLLEPVQAERCAMDIRQKRAKFE